MPLADIGDKLDLFWSGDEATELDGHGWESWLAAMHPLDAPMGDAHRSLWDWAWSIELGVPPSPGGFLALWPRGWGKSTTAELVVAALGARRKRRYVLYVCATQGDADKHVASIAALLESRQMARHYPEMSVRLVNKFGHSKGWSRTRLRASTGFTVDALGLDSTGARGTRMENQRPDLIVADDIDALHHSDHVVAKNEGTLTRSVIPAGSRDVAILFPQNLIHAGSIANRLYTREADWLTDRIVSGPYAAVDGLQYESTGLDEEGALHWKITGGTANWPGMNLDTCERQMNLSGPEAFVAESQNDVTTRKGALWVQNEIDRQRVTGVDYVTGHIGGFRRLVVAVDPSVSDSPNADECGVIVAGLGMDGHGYVLEDGSMRAHPQEWGKRVLDLRRKWGAEIVAERNQGYELVRVNINALDPHARVVLINASRGKEVRAGPVATLYREGVIHHVGSHKRLERQMCSWVPNESTQSPDRVDALVYAIAWLFPSTGVISEKVLRDARGVR